MTARRKWVTFRASSKKHIPSSANGRVDTPLCMVDMPWGWAPKISAAKQVAAMPICGDCARAARRIASYIEDGES